MLAYYNRHVTVLSFHSHVNYTFIKQLTNNICKRVYRVFQKSSPPPQYFLEYFHFGEVFLHEILQICWQFISTYIYQFLYIYLNISSNGVNFSMTTHRFQPLKFCLFTEKIKMQLFGNNVIFRHRVFSNIKTCYFTQLNGSM